MREFLIGFVKGSLSGVVPGMHINAIVRSINEPAGIISAYPAFILSSFILPIYLYSMNTDIGAIMLPSQRMALQGRSREALLLSTSGALFSFMILAIFLPFMGPFFLFLSSDYIALSAIILTVLVLFIRQRNRLYGLLIFVLTGFLGIASMRLPDGLMPMLSGFFGVPALLQKGNEVEMPETTDMRRNRSFLPLMAIPLGVVAASVKAVTPGTISVFLYLLLRNDEERMLAMGALSGANAIATMGNFYATGALRSGPAVQLARIEGAVPMHEALFLFLLSAILSFLLIYTMADRLGWLYKVINRVKFLFIAVLALLVFIFSGPAGLFLLAVSTTIGILTVRLKARRINCMGCIIVPAFLGLLR